MEGKPEQAKELSGSPRPAQQSALRRIEIHVWRRVLSGFLVLVPVLITFLILRIFIGYADRIFRPVIPGPLDFPGVGLVITLAVFYFVGLFFAGDRFQSLQDAVLTRVPMVSVIYSFVRQATKGFSSTKGQHYSRVVFIEWPRPGVKALGFVTGHLHSSKEGTPTIVVVYIPTVPNPTSGMLAWIPEEEVIETEISVEDAMKAIFSGGMVLPEIPAYRGLQPTQFDDVLADR